VFVANSISWIVTIQKAFFKRRRERRIQREKVSFKEDLNLVVSSTNVDKK